MHMKNIIKQGFSLLLALMLVMGLSATAFAAESSVTFENGRLVIFEPGSAYTDTDLFDNFKGVMPGDTLREEVTIQNRSDDCDYMKVYMRSVLHDGNGNPVSKEVLAQLEADERRGEASELLYMRDFLSQLSMTVKNGEDIIYNASADELNGLAENVYLGTLRRGESLKLYVELNVPIEMGNAYANRIGEVDWVFAAEGFDDAGEPLDLTVVKKWNVKGKEHPDSVQVTLYNGEQAVESVKLGDWNNWTYSWKELDGNGSWQILETSIPKGYVPSYSYRNGVVTVTNTESLIQTGQLSWPIPVMGVLGLLLIGYGLFVISKKRKNKRA